MTDMPPRWEEELDSVTLHNQALCSMDMSPTQGFHKLQFLMQQSTYPQETLQNLLILYCKHGYHDLASDVISTYSPVKDKYLSNVKTNNYSDVVYLYYYLLILFLVHTGICGCCYCTTIFTR